MYKDKKILGLIPARGGSKGLPRKNLIKLCGKPLLGWPIGTAKKSKYVDKIVVSTDDSEIAEKAIILGAEIPFIRPSKLATDTAKSSSVIEHAILFFKNKGEIFDYLLLLEPTSPLTEAQDVDRAIQILDEKRKIADSIVGVSRVEATHHEFTVTISEDGLIRPLSASQFLDIRRRQDISELYFVEGSLYISDTEVFLQKKSFYHNRTLPYIVPKWKAIEVDDIVDFICIEAIMKNLDRIKKENDFKR